MKPAGVELPHLSESDRFTANWLVERISALSDETHEKLVERLAIQEETHDRSGE